MFNTRCKNFRLIRCSLTDSHAGPVAGPIICEGVLRFSTPNFTVLASLKRENRKFVSVTQHLPRVLANPLGNKGSCALIGKQLEEQGMRNAAIENHNRLNALINGINAGPDFWDHAACYRAVINEGLGLIHR